MYAAPHLASSAQRYRPLTKPKHRSSTVLMHFLSGVDKSTFLAKFTIVPIPIWLELEKDRLVRPDSGYSPSAATGSFATGTDGSNRSPSASESVVNERQ
ncbi:MAG TPA: hypothetical protein VJ349_24775, partial [Stellaceae bacterium]|nr:hypothetical protein [Stellaceae bacterium]